ncbi:MAG: serine/threonine protein kinase [Pirellulales bacterium]|nr:serine/threonine protein kinase [Pirellulales bacterium]
MAIATESTTVAFRREYLVELPLPLAQLYSRAYNAKQARARHDYAFYLCEALIKLLATPMAATYLDEVQKRGRHAEAVDRLLPSLRLPSLGHWLGLLRELSRHFGELDDAQLHPLGHLWEQLNARRRDWPGALALFNRIKNGPDGQPASNQKCSALELFDALVQYRNTVFGHGASRVESFYEEEMGPLLLPAVTDLLDEGVLDMLGPPGSRLVCLSEIRMAGEGRAEIELRYLVGRESERGVVLELDIEEAEQLAPGCVAVEWPGHTLPQRLDPLLAFHESELSEEVLFLNRDRSGKHVEYLSYTTGRTVRDPEMEPAMVRMLAAIPELDDEDADGEADDRKPSNEDASKSDAEPTEEAKPKDGMPRVHDFEILAELGRGGMGVVYLAKQLSLGRIVALKTISADLLEDETSLARFRREMRVLGRCDHPNIVKVFSCGSTPNGQLYYAMEYVPGADLEQVWRELAGSTEPSGKSSHTWASAVRSASHKHLREATKKAPGQDTLIDFSRQSSTSIMPGRNFKSAGDDTSDGPAAPRVDASDYYAEDENIIAYQRHVVELIRDAASALQAVHDQGIVHRDVKPANLILTADGSRVVLMDFGLAKGQSTALTATGTGGLLGTLRYSAPEQLAAANVQVGAAADVRGLGVSMWELLTKRRLFGDADDERQLATWVLNHDVPPLRTVNPKLSPVLEAITAKATQRDVDNRIQTAGELADMLDAYLEDRPVELDKPKRLHALAARFAIPIIVLATMLPNIAAGVFNFVYNREQIIQAMTPESLSVFWTTQSIINAICYPLGIAIISYLIYLAFRPLGRMKRGEEVEPRVMAQARKHTLMLGHYAAMVSIGLWSVAGAVYPIAIHLASGSMPLVGYVHFFVSLVLCGLVAAAYPFFFNTWFSLSTIYPRLTHGSSYVSQDRPIYERLQVLNWRYFTCAGAVPMFTVAILSTIQSDSRLALGVFGLGGLVGFVGITPIFRKLLKRLTV